MNEKDQSQAAYGNWSVQKVKLKMEFPVLTDGDLYYRLGKKEEMLTRVREKLGKSQEEFSTLLSEM